MTTLVLSGVLATFAWPAASWGVSTALVQVGTCSGTRLGSGRIEAGPPSAVLRGQDFAQATIDGSTPISPPLTEILELGAERRALGPGDSLQCVLTVRNRRAQTTKLRLEPRGVLGSRHGAARYLDLSDPDVAATAGPWIVPAVRELTLRPRELARVPVTITIPPDPPTGSAYGAVDVVAPRVGARGADGAAVGFEPHTIASFLLRIGGRGAPRLHLRDVDAQRLRWNRDPWTLRADLDNDGTLHATPTSRVRIRSVFGNTITELHDTQRPLLPGGRTRLERSWNGVPWFGVYRYDLRVSAAPQQGGSTARASGWFVALPPAWVLVLAVLVLAAAGGGSLRRRRRAGDWDSRASFEDARGHDPD